jgi:hypothetical protein
MTFGLFLLFKYRVRAPPPQALQDTRLHIMCSAVAGALPRVGRRSSAAPTLGRGGAAVHALHLRVHGLRRLQHLLHAHGPHRAAAGRPAWPGAGRCVVHLRAVQLCGAPGARWRTAPTLAEPLQLLLGHAHREHHAPWLPAARALCAPSGQAWSRRTASQPRTFAFLQAREVGRPHLFRQTHWGIRQDRTCQARARRSWA